MKITVLGIGLMGAPMARRLLNAGFQLTLWNRSPDKAESLRSAGARVATSPKEAVQDADLIITMLSDGAAVAQVLFGLGDDSAAPAMKPGALLVDMSSILPEQAQAHAHKLAERGLGALDAPVSGGTVGAEAGSLAIMAGGDPTDFERARPALEVLGRPVHVGPAGSGQLCKLANQMIVGITIGAVAEALLLAEKGGANPAKVREALRGGFAESRILEVHGQRMVDHDFAKRGSLAIQLKDLRNSLHTAQGLGFDAPITQHLTGLYMQAFDQGLGELDQSALFKLLQARQSDT
jgi:3-hydroxyisobutyrate dehydrogenase-like beta-hydroxyacid dehydrogenase